MPSSALFVLFALKILCIASQNLAQIKSMFGSGQVMEHWNATHESLQFATVEFSNKTAQLMPW